jgi:NADPH:quinone reductase-like Zn-dependent oxidoreductase
MRAAVQTRYGPPEVVLISEVGKPAAGDDGVLVRVHATTVNRTDCACRAARPFFMRFFTGLVRPRAAVLGNEFAGVVEAVVTAVCDTDHVELVKGLGASRVIDYTAADFTKDEQEYDVILDSVGKSSFSRCKRLLKPGGIYISSELGPLAQNPFLALIAPLHGGKKVLFPIPRHDQAMVRYIRELIESGQFKPVIDRTYPLDQIVEAYRYVETGQKTGNVVITLEPLR